MRKILRNRAQCVLCDDIIESKHTHDFVGCKCGEIFLDGGLSYCRAGFTKIENVRFLTEYDSEEEDEVSDGK